MMLRIKNISSQLVNDYMKGKAVSEETKIIYVYRYLSWALTSVAYLAGRPYSIIFFKLGVIVSLFICSKIINDLYIKFKESKGILRTLVLIETMGISLLLMPTGGLNSPFIWYALNPTLVAASYMPMYFCWMNLVFYLFAGTTMSYFLFNPNNINMVGTFMQNSNLVLIFMLITLAVQLLSRLTRKLYAQTLVLEDQKKKMEEINKALQLSNIEKQESIEHIMSLYQIIETLNNHSSKEKLFEVLSVYTAKLTKSSMSFFWFPDTIKDMDLIKTSSSLCVAEQQEIISELRGLGLDRNQTKGIQEINMADRYFIAIPILSPTTYFGLIAIQKKYCSNSEVIEQNIKLLEFIAELSAVILERFNLEDMEDQLLVMEEQNRIANEIHDSVSQRLFSISYAIHGVLGRWKILTKEELKEYLTEMRESSNLAMQELRNSIYKLSSKKKGEKLIQVTLKAFLDSIVKLHHVVIDFEAQCDENLLSLSLKKSIIRIIREACGNAIRHGKCHKIQLNLALHEEFISLSIYDDGIGFILSEGEGENQKGLGVSNMRNLVNSYNGSIEIISEIGKGTEIQIMIPGKGFDGIEQGGVAI